MLIYNAKINFYQVNDENEMPFTRIHVNFLSQRFSTDDKFRELFAPFGDIIHINLIKDNNGQPKGFGFVEFADSESAVRACKLLNGMPSGAGRRLFVGRAWSRQERYSALVFKLSC